MRHMETAFAMIICIYPVICMPLFRFCDLVNSLLHQTESVVEDSSPLDSAEGVLEVNKN